ncbi:MAG: FkbM family methyltransferase [Pseudanabaena sp.]
MESLSSFGDLYLEYIFNTYPDIDASFLSTLEEMVEDTNWEDPQSSKDWNNLAVIDLLEADNTTELSIRGELLQQAKTKLEKGFSLDQSVHCAAHYILLQSILGEDGSANSLALHTVVNTPQTEEYTTSRSTCLAYLPANPRGSQEFSAIINADDGFKQGLILLAEVIRRSQFIFYNSIGIRFLRIAHQIFANSPNTCLMLGVTQLMSNQPEAVSYLHHAWRIDPHNSFVLQALYLAYRQLNNLDTASYWMNYANQISLSLEDTSAAWEWTKLLVDQEFTYVEFEQELIMAVEPRFQSIVTSVLLAQGDWFEREMEFWRDHITAGMTVIDVGANAGVYTFSAAKRVGADGLVLAIEPFSQCVEYLKETCRINKLDWVKVCAGAASDRNGKAKLSISLASELNELISEEDGKTRDPSSFEEVECFTLDSLIEEYNVKQVDFLKIDAEGHEIQVLKGSDRLLTEFAPIIIYENIASNQVSNLPVADFLRSIGYQLFRYQPYLQKLIPINSHDDFQGSLNVIAVPPKFII